MPRTTRTSLVHVVLLAVLTLMFAGMWQIAGSDSPMSTIDEHMHLDTHATLHNGGWPFRGAIMRDEVVHEWACGVNHESAPLAPEACGDPNLGPQSLPSGQYSSGYIHYPTYFLGAEAYRSVAAMFGGGGFWVDTYRHYATIVFFLGVLVLLFGARQLGFRGSALVAAVLAPIAGASVGVFGTMANPQSASILAGALIAWRGLVWIRTGRGFWWLAAATGLASVLAVTHTFAAGAFIIAALIAWLLDRMRRPIVGPWHPSWWHAMVLGLIVVVPAFVYGRFITARATQSNEELYAFAALKSNSDILIGAVSELWMPHFPWQAGGLYVSHAESLLARMGEAAAAGAAGWLGPLVVGWLIFGLVMGVKGTRTGRGARQLTQSFDASLEPAMSAEVNVPQEMATQKALDAELSPVAEDTGPKRPSNGLLLTGLGVIAVLLLYGPLMRVSNAVMNGFDFGVVPRYAIGLAALLVWVLLLTIPSRWVARTLAVIALVANLWWVGGLA